MTPKEPSSVIEMATPNKYEKNNLKCGSLKRNLDNYDEYSDKILQNFDL